MNNVLVVAYDGLDSELVREFNLKNIRQKEEGTIDNKTDMTSIYTSELFASFITGQTHESHGVKGLKKSMTPLRSKLIDVVCNEYLRKNIRGFHRLNNFLGRLLNADQRFYKKSDLECDTLFEKVENSRSMFVPSYEMSKLSMAEGHTRITKIEGYNFDDKIEIDWEFDYKTRRRKLFSELENEIVGPRNFLMVHFHNPDAMQHKYGDEGLGRIDRDKLRKRYNQLDKDAGRIKEKADRAGYDYIIFMSDHGLVTESAHNENAFYSSNQKIFGENIPHITDFHDKILELVEVSE